MAHKEKADTYTTAFHAIQTFLFLQRQAINDNTYDTTKGINSIYGKEAPYFIRIPKG